MDRDPVSSSLLSSVGYDPEEKLLEVELEDGAVYQYVGVPEKAYRDLLDAGSPGRYLNQHLEEYEYVRVR